MRSSTKNIVFKDQAQRKITVTFTNVRMDRLSVRVATRRYGKPCIVRFGKVQYTQTDFVRPICVKALLGSQAVSKI